MITGDIAATAKPEEYEVFTEAAQLLQELASQHGKETTLLVVPGNHDIILPENKTVASLKEKLRTSSRNKLYNLRHAMQEVEKRAYPEYQIDCRIKQHKSYSMGAIRPFPSYK